MTKLERIEAAGERHAEVADLLSLRDVTRARRFYGTPAKCRRYREDRDIRFNKRHAISAQLAHLLQVLERI